MYTKVYNYSSEVHLYTKVYRNFYRQPLILCQTIGFMETKGGLSEELKYKIAGTKVALIGSETVGLIESAIKRMGFRDTVISSEYSNLPECDVVISTATTKEEYRNMLTHYKTSGVTVIGAFNFGIGACVSVFDPASSLPHFIEDKYGDNVVESMLKYTDGYSKFWLISQNSWVEYAKKMDGGRGTMRLNR